MATAEVAVRWLEACSDRLSAILIKETRQALKSRQFVATFMLMLGVSWLISVFGIIFWGPGVRYVETGPQFFFMYYFVLAVANFLIVPFAAYRSLLNERDLNTFELLSITTLSPKSIVAGKLLSSIVQLFIYYSAIAPFIAFTYCLNGITMTTIGFLLFASLLAAVELSMFSLMLSTFSRQRQTQVVLSLALLGSLFWALWASMPLVFSALSVEIPFDRPEFWWTLTVVLTYVIATFILFLQVATAQLTFEAGNRSSGLRITCSVIFWMSLAWIGVGLHYTLRGGVYSSVVNKSMICGCSNLLSAWLALIGLFSVTEDERFSHRVQRDLPRSPLLRLLFLPYLPGGSRGYVYILLHLAALWLACDSALNLLVADFQEPEVRCATTIRYYVAIYLGLGAFLGRGLRALSSDIRTPHTRVMLVFLLAGGSIVPHLLQLWDNRAPTNYPLLFLSDPFSTSFAVNEGNDPIMQEFRPNPFVPTMVWTAFHWTNPVLAAVAIIVIGCNLPAIVRAISETLGGRKGAAERPARDSELLLPVIDPLTGAASSVNGDSGV